VTKKAIARRLIFYEIVGFSVTVLMLWANEILDLPHVLFGVKATPINWSESLFETLLVLTLGVCTTFFTWRLLQHIKYLEGFLPVCSFCKRIRLGEDWIPIEDFISKHSEAVFSHGLCPECAAKHYPEIFSEYEQGAETGERIE
jgi:hypothetical protein